MEKLNKNKFTYDISVPISQRYALIAEKMKSGFTVNEIALNSLEQKETIYFEHMNDKNLAVGGGHFHLYEVEELRKQRSILLSPTYRGGAYKRNKRNVVLIPALNITYNSTINNYGDIDHYLFKDLDIPINKRLNFRYTTCCGCDSSGINKDIISLDFLDKYGIKISNFFSGTNHMNSVFNTQSISLNNLYKIRKFVEKYIINNEIPKNKEKNQNLLLKTLNLLLTKSNSILYKNDYSYANECFTTSYKNANLSLGSIGDISRIEIFRRSLTSSRTISNITLDLINTIKLVNEVDFKRYDCERPIGFNILTDYLLIIDNNVNAFKAVINKELAKVL